VSAACNEVERYGHYSSQPRARTTIRSNGARSVRVLDIARIGGKYSDDWHRDHLRNPRSVVPASIMPGYPFLEQTLLNAKHISEDMKVLDRGCALYARDGCRLHRMPRPKAPQMMPRRRLFVTRYPKAISLLGGNAGKTDRG